MINVFLRAYFDVLGLCFRFHFHLLRTEFFLSLFGVLVDSIGGTPDKRIPEGFFRLCRTIVAD